MSRSTVLNYTLIIFLLSACHPSAAIPWPVVNSVEIYGFQEGGMTNNRYNFRGTSALLDMGLPLIPKPRNLLPPRWYGIHCREGENWLGFKGCSWTSGHGPTESYMCGFVDYDSESWTLKEECAVPATWSWEGHIGAAPGGECSVFGRELNGSLITPWGVLDATTVANSGSAMCVKATPPLIPCEMGAFGDLDHGVIGLNGTDTKSGTTTVSCGGTPRVELLGGGVITLAPGVSSTLTATMTNPSVLRVESRLTSQSGTPGRYSASKIVVVSPE